MEQPDQGGITVASLSLSIVLPVHRPAGLATLVAECLAAAARYVDDYELILVVDGNAAASAAAARLAATHWPVAALHYPRRRGYRFVLYEGWSVARGDYILTLEGSNLASGAEISRLLALMPSYAAVFGYRERPAPDPIERLVATAIRARSAPAMRDPTLHLALLRADLRDLLSPAGPDALVVAELYAAAQQRALAVAEVAVAGAPAAPGHSTLRAGAVLLLAGGLWLLRRRLPRGQRA